MKFRNLRLVICLTLTILLFGCSNTEEKRSVTWGGPKNIAMLPILAEDQGFFSEEGLEATRQDIQTGKLTMDALLNGNLNFGVLVETNIAFIKFQPESDLKVIAIISEKFDDAIVARKDKGVEDAKDLVGKRLGLTYGTTSQAFAVEFLQAQGIDLKSVNIVNMPPPSIQAALVSGDLDAGSIWQPFRFNVKAELKDKAVEFNDTGIYRAFAIIAVRSDYAEQNKEEIAKFLKALIKAKQFLDENSNEAQAILSREIAIPLDTLKAVWNEYELEVQLSPELLDAIEREGNWIVKTEPEFQGKQIPDYSTTIFPEPLRTIDPQRVQGF